jgi:hypothetical protein
MKLLLLGIKQCKKGGDLLEIPSQQRRATSLPLTKYQVQAADKHQAVYSAYCSVGYTKKQISDYFDIHYSQVSLIVAKDKTLSTLRNVF